MLADAPVFVSFICDLSIVSMAIPSWYFDPAMFLENMLPEQDIAFKVLPYLRGLKWCR